jgi:hypothetical protein
MSVRKKADKMNAVDDILASYTDFECLYNRVASSKIATFSVVI